MNKKEEYKRKLKQ